MIAKEKKSIQDVAALMKISKSALVRHVQEYKSLNEKNMAFK